MDGDGPSRTRVALIAPHSIIRAGLRTLLESTSRFEIVGEGQTAPEILGAHPDVVLIDAPPFADPAPIVKAAAAMRDVAIVVLVDEEDLTQCSAAIAAGAVGLVGRQHPPQALFAAIDRVRAGETSIDRTMLSGVVRLTTPREMPADPFQALSSRERDVHGLVTQGLRNKEIAKRLFISEATVRHHLTSIFGKLGVSGRVELLAAQWRAATAGELASRAMRRR
jgi:DNA-binding NarL/FixJ family response regulator